MKKPVLSLFVWLLTAIPQLAFAQNQANSETNRWKIKAMGVGAMWGMEKYFQPLTFAYFERNVKFAGPELFAPPPGGSDNPRRPEFDTPPLGLALQVAWAVGKKQNEIRTGFGFQEHGNYIWSGTYYYPAPDVYRYHEIILSDDYVMAQVTSDYVVHSKPLLQVARLRGSVGGTFGISTRHSIIRSENIIDYDTADFRPWPTGPGFILSSPVRNNVDITSFSSLPRIQTGLRITAGVEFLLTRFGIPMGLSGEWGYGIVTQKFLSGGTLNHKWTEFAQVQARYFLY